MECLTKGNVSPGDHRFGRPLGRVQPSWCWDTGIYIFSVNTHFIPQDFVHSIYKLLNISTTSWTYNSTLCKILGKYPLNFFHKQFLIKFFSIVWKWSLRQKSFSYPKWSLTFLTHLCLQWNSSQNISFFSRLKIHIGEEILGPCFQLILTILFTFQNFCAP